MVAYTKNKLLTDKVIFVLDDDKPSLDLAEAILRPTQAKLELFTNPEEGLEFLQNNTPDLVVLDVMMPRVDGWEIYDKMRQSRFNLKTPIIFLSCLFEAEEESFLNLRNTNCTFLSKPIKTDKLLETVEQMI